MARKGIAVFIIVTNLVAMPGGVVWAWQNPSAAPPGGNLPAPLNVSATNQTKTGGLTLGGLTVDINTLYVDTTNDRVGIGTVSPAEKLHIYGNSASAVQPIIQNDGGQARLRIWSTGTSYPYLALSSGNFDGPSSWAIGLDATNKDLRFVPSNDAADAANVVFKRGGNVGIGTTNPAYKLDVAGQVSGRTGLCIDTDCRTIWPSGITQISQGDGIALAPNPITSTGTVAVRLHPTDPGLGFVSGQLQNQDQGSDQNIFKSIANDLGSVQFSAGSNTDTLRFAAGSGASVAFDSLTKKVTYTNTGVTSVSCTTITCSGTNPATFSIGTGAITNTQLQNSSITVTAGTGLSGGGSVSLGGATTLTNADQGSAQNIFKSIANSLGSVQFSAGSNSDTVRFEGTGAASVSFDSLTKKVTINSTDTNSGGTITGVTAGSGLTGGGTAGTVTLDVGAGTGISVGADTVTNTDLGSAQNIFKSIANSAGSVQFSAGSNSDTVRFSPGTGMSASFNATTKEVTYTNTGDTNPADDCLTSGCTISGNLNVTGDYQGDGATVLRLSDNSNTVVNPILSTGAVYLNWDRGTTGVIFGNGAGVEVARLTTGGSLGLGLSPSYKLDVASAGVTTARLGTGGDTVLIGGTSAATLNVGAGSGKINAGTVDPIYNISGAQYATYLPGMTGQKEETTGVTELRIKNKELRIGEAVIDFANAEKGSDLWIFWNITDFGKNWENLVVLLTPGFDSKVRYKKDPVAKKLWIYGDTAGEASYRLTAPRFDHDKWQNIPEPQEGLNGLEVEIKNY